MGKEAGLCVSWTSSPQRGPAAPTPPSEFLFSKNTIFPLSSLHLRHKIPLSISFRAKEGCGTETSICVPTAHSHQECHSKLCLEPGPSSHVPAVCSRRPTPSVHAHLHSVCPQPQSVVCKAGGWAHTAGVSVSTGSCKVARVAVDPDTFSCLLASAQQFRELTQAEVNKEGPAPSSGEVRTLSPASKAAAAAVLGTRTLAKRQQGEAGRAR